MKTFWLFRSNIKNLEYYHQYTDLDKFEKNCHDFYMLLPIWLLRNNYFDEVIIWRLSKQPKKDIKFIVNGKSYIQRWVRNLKETFNYPFPEMSLFRGGFKEYDDVTRIYPRKFGTKLYLGTGKRIYPQWNGNYTVYLQEDEKDFSPNRKCLPFYKTASPHIFNFPSQIIFDIQWDLCWPCNFTQITQKGQEFFIRTIGNSDYLKSLAIIHCGNKPEMGKRLCKKYGVNNIEFLGSLERKDLSRVLNQSKFGVCMSNRVDGCPRITTEILMTETPLIIRDKTRLLPYYKQKGVVEVSDQKIVGKIKQAMRAYPKLRSEVAITVRNELSFDNICKKNIELWQKI